MAWSAKSSGAQVCGTVTAWSISGNKVVQDTFSNSLVPSADLANDKHIIEIPLLMENPQASPSTTITEHAARIAALPAYAASTGYGLIDAFTGDVSANPLSGGLGLHPDTTGSDFIALKVAQGFGPSA